MSAQAHFREALLATGLDPTDAIEPGRFYRFPGDGKGPRNRAGWCKLFDDGQGGVFGDWSTGLVETWQVPRLHLLSRAERAGLRRQVEEARRERDRIRKAERQAAAEAAQRQYDSSGPADPGHPYLQKKGVPVLGDMRQVGRRLLLPMRDSTGTIRGCQAIADDDTKLFTRGMGVTGTMYEISATSSSDIVAIGEGFATMATVNQATGWRTFAAFSASNLPSVATTVHQHNPGAVIVLAADNDTKTTGNPGMTEALRAAAGVGGVVIAPQFRPQDAGTDWNDYSQFYGLAAAGRALHRATESADGK